jgi:hypothetical protein
MSKVKRASKNNGTKFLSDAFSLEQKLLLAKINLSSNTITHSGVQGEVNEKYFINILRSYLPKRYSVDSAIVIDSSGSTSDQIDVVVYDNLYTPTLLDQENHRYIPAESVYAIFEVKPSINKAYLKYAAEKALSVRNLIRTSIPIRHAGGEYPAKSHFEIIGGIVAASTTWKDGLNSNAFRSHIASFTGAQSIDFALAAGNGCYHKHEEKVHYGPKNNALAFFVFRLLQHLQSLGTAPAVDWSKYAKALK